MTREIFILAIIVVCVFIIMYDTSKGPRWGARPRAEYVRLIHKLGKPHYINKNPKGVAIWKRFPLCVPFERIMLIDESVVHYTPHRHCSFLYVTVKYEIDEEMIDEILSCSEAVMYDKLKRELTVRSNSLENAMTWLVLIHDVNKQILDHKQISSKIKELFQVSYSNAEKNYSTLQTIKNSFELKEKDYSCC